MRQDGKEYWQLKYKTLVSRLGSFADEIEKKIGDFKPATERAFMQSRRIYVNFDYDVCDSKDYADDNWGEGNYDVYDLNKELSPFDQESEDDYAKKEAPQTNATL